MKDSLAHGVRWHRVPLGGFVALLIALALPTQAGAQQGSCFGQPATITGTDQVDTISGTEGPDVIDGGGGVDFIDGLGGDDLICAGSPAEGGIAEKLTGGGGRDRLLGGTEEDKLFLRDGTRDVEGACGDGSDSVDLDLPDMGQRAGTQTTLTIKKIPTPGCEVVTSGAVNEGPNARVSTRAVRLTRRGRAGVRIACPRGLSASCAGRLNLRTARKVRVGGRRRRVALGSRRYRIAPGTNGVVRVRLSRRRRALVTLLRRVRVEGTAVEQGSIGPKTTIATFLLKRAR